jgi:DNA-binding NtrC family response regulator
LLGFSESIARAREQVAHAMETDFPVLIVGEPGTGRRNIAQLLHESRTSDRRQVYVPCRGENVPALLFDGSATSGVSDKGLIQQAHHSSLLLGDVAALDLDTQRRLVRTVRASAEAPRGGQLRVRFIGLNTFDLQSPEMQKGRFDAAFCNWLSATRIDIPPLRDHLEDLPMIAETLLRRFSDSRKKLTPSAHRALLAYAWPGNLAELRMTLQTVSLVARHENVGDRDILAILRRHSTTGRQTSIASERDWVLDGLRRNRFRRTETAQFLRLSRKTLYNKMRQYGLLDV